jgi:hypothetical protein
MDMTAFGASDGPVLEACAGRRKRAGPSCHLGIEGSPVALALAKSAVEIQACRLLTQARSNLCEVAAGCLVNKLQA